jgi:hypothetical protein
MQPVQDITVDDRVSRTQFRTLEDPNGDELNSRRRDVGEAQPAEVRDVASDQRNSAFGPAEDDRETAHASITPAFIDQTLYDAFGQRRSRRCSRS